MKTRNEIQKEILNSLPNPCHGLLNLAPRVGKTKLTIDIIKREKPKSILWVTENTQLRDVAIPEEFKKWKTTTYLKKTNIICYQSLHKIEGKYDLIILDEYQCLSPKNSVPLTSRKIIYKNIIGLSGTHPKHQEKQDIYDLLNLNIISSMDIDEAVDNNIIAPYIINIVKIPLNNKDNNFKAGNKFKPFYTTEQKNYDFMSKGIAQKYERGEIVPKMFYLARMRFIYNLKSKSDYAKKLVNNLKGKTLIFAGSIEQAESLGFPTYHSKSNIDNLTRFKENKIDRLVCVNKGGIGVTYTGVDNFIVIQVNSNKRGDCTQKICRSLVLQEGYKANIFILCASNTVDENWVEKTLEDFNEKNIKQINYKKYE